MGYFNIKVKSTSLVYDESEEFWGLFILTNLIQSENHVLKKI